MDASPRQQKPPQPRREEEDKKREDAAHRDADEGGGEEEKDWNKVMEEEEREKKKDASRPTIIVRAEDGGRDDAAATAVNVIQLPSPSPPPPSRQICAAACPRAARVVFIDLEATGTGTNPRLIQFGAMTLDSRTMFIPQRRERPAAARRAEAATGDESGEPEEPAMVEFLVRPPRPINLNPRVVRMTGITERMLAGEPEFRGRAKQIRRILGGAVWAGHAIEDNDVPMLWREFAAIGETLPPCAGTLDTQRMARLMGLNAPHLANSLRLGKLAEWFGLGSQEKHGALSDAMLAYFVYTRMAARDGLWRLVVQPRQ